MQGRSLGITVVLAILTACAPVSRDVFPPSPPASPIQVRDDTTLYRHAVDLLRTGNYAQAQPVLRELTSNFPRSSYTPSAAIYLKLLDEIETLTTQVTRCQKDMAKLQRDLKDTKGALDKALTEKQQLAKELEELEKDLEYLKTVEVELQKRIKSLR